MDISKINDGLQISAAIFGLLAALFALGAYFTSSHIQAAFENKIRRLEKEQAGRFLTPKQTSTISEALRPLDKPSQPLHITALQGNAEAIRLANSLKDVFSSAGFSVAGVREDLIIGGTGAGVLIRQRNVDGTVGVTISRTLSAAGIGSRVIALDRLAPETVEVIVAHKP